MTKKQKVIGNKTQITDPLAPIKLRFQRLKTVRAELAKLKVLYQEHDRLMTELLPLFIKVESDNFTIAREISLGTEKYRLTPHFYDEKKGQLMSKVWKSTAFESASIE